MQVEFESLQCRVKDTIIVIINMNFESQSHIRLAVDFDSSFRALYIIANVIAL
jgi:hypothetical protein